MSGETEKDVSGWTVDTLHQHEQTQHADLRRYMEERFRSVESQRQALLGTLAERTHLYTEQHKAMREVLLDRFANHAKEHEDMKVQLLERHVGQTRDWSVLRAMLDERYATQTKAIDAAFIAQQTAMQTAFTAADRAVQAALQSAKEAVTKADVANEKRFDAVNEFRSQLTEQTATFIPRAEAEQRIASNSEKIDAITARLDRNEGRSSGVSGAWGYLIGAVGLASAVVALVIALQR